MARYGTEWQSFDRLPGVQFRWLSPSDDITVDGELLILDNNSEESVSILLRYLDEMILVLKMLQKNAQATERYVKTGDWHE